MKKSDWVFLLAVIVSAGLSYSHLAVGQTTEVPKRLLWGDTHLHTKMSPDAYMMGNRSVTPDDAYRYAKGLPVISAKSRAMTRIDRPLDFLAVTEHAEYMGMMSRLFEGDPTLAGYPSTQELVEMAAAGKAREAFLKIVATANDGEPVAAFVADKERRAMWHEVIAAAERHNQPGVFTTLIGWEWSSLSDGANLHRIVMQKEGGDVAGKYIPFSLFDSDRPEALWQWLETTSERVSASFVAIPHNGNVSKGKMFSELDSDGQPLSATYAMTRARWEPVYEMTQIKGDGETMAELSPGDEFAEFETYSYAMDARPDAKSEMAANGGDYARTALLKGLQIEAGVGVNPFAFGMIGASDSHTGLSAVEEDNFGGKFAIDSIPEGKDLPLTPGVTGNNMSAAGLAAVWTRENSREEIFAAFKRREVYATTGPRIGLRFFAGWYFGGDDLTSADLADTGYAKGVPMGGELSGAPQGRVPALLIEAVKDPQGANLDRLQVVKGWLDEQGRVHEQVFDVAASDHRLEAGGRLQPVGNTVDLQTGSYTNTIGDPRLTVVWQDSQFNAAQKAFYYVRVLQIPTPRHTLFSALAMKQPHPADIPPTIQERAYSSPIWYRP